MIESLKRFCFVGEITLLGFLRVENPLSSSSSSTLVLVLYGAGCGCGVGRGGGRTC
jgi:hypothetical protein